MDAETYKLSRIAIKQLKPDNYLASHTVIVLNLSMLFMAVILFSSGSPVFFLAGAMLWALQMNHSYLIVHECGHASFYKKAWMNDLCGNVFAFFALLPFYSRRLEHATHHREAGSFHEPSTRRAMDRFKLIDPRMATFITVCWKLWIPIFALNEHVMLWTLPFQQGISKKIRNTAIVVAAIYGLMLVSLLMVEGSGVVLLKFLLVFYMYMMLVEFFNLPHHLSSPVEDIHGAVPLYEQSKYSRSCSPMPAPFGKWLVLNFNYHIAHHLYPAVHWTKVPEAHQIMLQYDASLGEGMEPEFKINRDLRRKSLREALNKYFDQQYKEKAALQQGSS